MSTTEFRRGRHSVSRLVIHLVCVTKFRRKVFDDASIAFLQGHCARVARMLGAELLACDGDSDHLHLMLEYPPTLAVSVMVNAIKGTSSRMLRQSRPDIASRYWRGVLWSPSYFVVSAGGAPLEHVKRYVENQRTKPSASPSTSSP